MRIAVALFLLSSTGFVGCSKPEPTAEGGRASTPGPVTIGPGGEVVLAPSTKELTHKDLLDKMRAAGLKVNMAPAGSEQLYTIRDQADADIWARKYHSSERPEIQEPDVLCAKHRDEQSAREAAGRTEKGSYAWGVYAFRGQPKLLNLVKKTLTGESVKSPVFRFDTVLDSSDLNRPAVSRANYDKLAVGSTTFNAATSTFGKGKIATHTDLSTVLSPNHPHLSGWATRTEHGQVVIWWNNEDYLVAAFEPKAGENGVLRWKEWKPKSGMGSAEGVQSR